MTNIDIKLDTFINIVISRNLSEFFRYNIENKTKKIVI